MHIDRQQAERLLSGNHRFSMWSLSVFVTRLKQIYSADKSEDTLDKCVAELNSFVAKFKQIMGRDYELIENLKSN